MSGATKASTAKEKIFSEGVPLNEAKCLLSQRIYESTQYSLAKRCLMVDEIPDLAEPCYNTAVDDRVVYVHGRKVGTSPFATYKVRSKRKINVLLVPLFPMLPDDLGKYARKIEDGRFFPKEDTNKSTLEALTDWCVFEEKMFFDMLRASCQKPERIGFSSRGFSSVAEWMKDVDCHCMLIHPDDLYAVSASPGFTANGPCIPKGCKFDQLGKDHTWMGMTVGMLGVTDVFATKSCDRGRIYLLPESDYLGVMPIRSKLPPGAFILSSPLDTMMECGMAIPADKSVRAADIK
jgi:hypothetical protein